MSRSIEMGESSSSDNPHTSDSNEDSSTQPLNDSMENSMILSRTDIPSFLNSTKTGYTTNTDQEENRNSDTNFPKFPKQLDQQVNHQHYKQTGYDDIESASDFNESDNDEDCEIDEETADEDDLMDSDDSSEFSSLSGFTEFFGQDWKAMNWIQLQMSSGANPREILSQILSKNISSELDDITLWKILASMLTEPPRRQKLPHISTIDDVVNLMLQSQKIIVLTGAGVSVSCGIPDFRSADGIYARLAKDFPDLPDPQAMFDIQYFLNDPRPFYKFAREIYPGQFVPSLCHRFIKFLEQKGKLLRNYTQNIDTLEQVAGIRNVIECHGSFATASCTKCKHKQTAEEIRENIFAQKIPVCPKCQPETSHDLLLINDNDEKIDLNNTNECTDDKNVSEILNSENGETSTEQIPSGSRKIYSRYRELVENGVMKPDIVFFGEGLPEAFHSAIADDKDECDLLIVIGSSLKVRPVALIPNLVPPHVPQILINLEQLPHLDFDVELLGDSDTTIKNLCQMLGNEWTEICPKDTEELVPIIQKTEIVSHEHSLTLNTKQISETETQNDITSTSSKIVLDASSNTELVLNNQL